VVQSTTMRIFVLLLMVGCGAGNREASQRWPHHREQHDQRLQQLEQRVEQLEREVEDLRAQRPAPAAPQS